LVQIDFAVLILFYAQMDNLRRVLVLSQEISQSQKTHRRQIDKCELIERFVRVVELGNMKKQQIHHRTSVFANRAPFCAEDSLFLRFDTGRPLQPSTT
jgi:hypothetical protein